MLRNRKLLIIILFGCFCGSIFEFHKLIKKLNNADRACHDITDRDPIIDNDVDKDLDPTTLKHRFNMIALKCRSLKSQNKGLKMLNNSQHQMLHNITFRIRRILANPNS